ncbi:hypothetical protein [Streptosporangium sp. NPDC002607]
MALIDLIGARTEGLRALVWSEVDLGGKPRTDTPPWIAVWRSVREGGDTKTRKSRRSLALPRRCVEALREHRTQQAKERETAGASSSSPPWSALPWTPTTYGGRSGGS